MSTTPRSDAQTVVITGLGATTPVGGDVASTWDGLLAGRSGVRSLTEEWASELPVQFAARVAVDPGDVLERVEARKLDRTQQLALIAAREAWADAGTPDVDPERLGVSIATGIGGALTLLGSTGREISNPSQADSTDLEIRCTNPAPEGMTFAKCLVQARQNSGSNYFSDWQPCTSDGLIPQWDATQPDTTKVLLSLDNLILNPDNLNPLEIKVKLLPCDARIYWLSWHVFNLFLWLMLWCEPS